MTRQLTFRQWGWLFALLATVVYSTNAPIARAAILAGMDPNTLVFGRFVLGNLLFGLTLSCTTVGHWAEGHRVGEHRVGAQRPFDRRGFGLSLLAGMINGLMLLAGAWGLVVLSASIATLLSIALTPLFVMGLLRLRGERSSAHDLLRLVLGLIGLYFLIGVQGAANGWGVAVTALSAFLYALHMVLVQWFLRPYNIWLVTATLILGASLPAGLLWWQMGASLYIPGTIGWAALLIQGVAATFLARVLIYEAVKRIGSAQIALLTPLEAGLTVLWSLLWLSERITAWQSVGIGLILLSAMWVFTPPRLLLIGRRRKSSPL